VTVKTSRRGGERGEAVVPMVTAGEGRPCEHSRDLGLGEGGAGEPKLSQDGGFLRARWPKNGRHDLGEDLGGETAEAVCARAESLRVLLFRLAYAPGEVAILLGVSVELVKDLLRTGELKSVKAGRRRLISRKNIDDFLAGAEASCPAAESVSALPAGAKASAAGRDRKAFIASP